MKLKLIESNTEYHAGYGAGSGSVSKDVYECPCGKGEVIYEKDNIPGFRDSDLFVTCKECADLYEIGIGEAKKK